jgi:hypothetical protein
MTQRTRTQRRPPRFRIGERVIDARHGVPGTIVRYLSVTMASDGELLYEVQHDDGGAGVAREADLCAVGA